MATAPKQTPTPPPADPPAPPSTAPPADLGARVDGLEAEQKRQGGLLEQILGRLPGNGPSGGQGAGDGGNGPAPAAGKSVAEQVREGIEALERERATAAEADANKTAREDYAKRLAALEERSPLETAATPAGAFRATAQRVFFGITEPRK
jgi:hypothetical protein